MSMSVDQMIEAVSAADKGRAEAILAKDFDGLANYLSDELLYVHSSSTRETKSEYLDRLRTQFYVYSGFEKGPVTARVAGGAVLLTGSVVIHVAVKGTPKIVKATYLSVWVQEASHWRMVGWQSTPIPQS